MWGEYNMYINNDVDYIKYLKNKSIVIFGAGAIGKRVCNELLAHKINVYYFCDNDKMKIDQMQNGIKIISFNDLLEKGALDYIIIIASEYQREMKEQLLNNGIINFISYNQIDFVGGEAYYDEEYFLWQKKIGAFGAKVKKGLFEKYIRKTDVIVEFGSGGGYLLKELECKDKIGIEINDTARENAKSIGIKSVKFAKEIDDIYADVIISTATLEHVLNPFGILKELKPKLKEGGKIIFHVPHEGFERDYEKGEINNHLYTWNCLNLGNLFKAAGYFVCSVEQIEGQWPVEYEKIYDTYGSDLFEEINKIRGKIYGGQSCLIVACK